MCVLSTLLSDPYALMGSKSHVSSGGCIFLLLCFLGLGWTENYFFLTFLYKELRNNCKFFS